MSAPAAPPAPVLGLLPAAGRGLRFGASGYAKELFPLLWQGGDPGDLSPRPICDLALRQIRLAGAERCAVVISPHKTQVVQVLGGGEGLSLGYVVQPEPRGLPHAVRCARPWLGDADVVLALPDTVVLPQDALLRVHQARLTARADLALGVFPVEEPERLGPVELSADGAVLRVHDKPAGCQIRNSWAVASWSARFTAFCADWDQANDHGGRGERALGHAFEAARQAGLALRAVPFDDGLFVDIGTPAGLRQALRALADHGLLLPDQALPPGPGR